MKEVTPGVTAQNNNIDALRWLKPISNVSTERGRGAMFGTATGAVIRATIFCGIGILALFYVAFAGMPGFQADSGKLDAKSAGVIRLSIPYKAEPDTPANAGLSLPKGEGTKSGDPILLVGIIHSSNGVAQALLRAGNGSDGKWLSVGDTIKGWRIKEIAARGAVVETEGETMQLELNHRNEPPFRR
jgi:hypothetical protein